MSQDIVNNVLEDSWQEYRKKILKIGVDDLRYRELRDTWVGGFGACFTLLTGPIFEMEEDYSMMVMKKLAESIGLELKRRGIRTGAVAITNESRMNGAGEPL